MKLAQQMTAGYVQLEFGYNAWDILKKNPQIKTLRMINYSASPSPKRLAAEKVAAGFLYYFEAVRIKHSQDHDLAAAKEGLTKLIYTGTGKAQQLGAVIDTHYTFKDEE